MVLVSEGFSGGRNFRLNRLEGINMPTKMLADNKNIVIAIRYAFILLRCIPMRVFPLSFLKKVFFGLLLKRSIHPGLSYLFYFWNVVPK